MIDKFNFSLILFNAAKIQIIVYAVNILSWMIKMIQVNNVGMWCQSYYNSCFSYKLLSKYQNLFLFSLLLKLVV